MTVGVVEYLPKKGGKAHYGVCSKWLEEKPLGETVYGFIRAYDLYFTNK